MSVARSLLLTACIIVLCCGKPFVTFSAPAASRSAGFYLPDSVSEVTLRYKRANNLILLPVTINDTIHLNLILDTGCRNVVLFGKRFMKLFDIQPDKQVQFSGLGSGNPVSGRVSLGNEVAIDAVRGHSIPVVIVPNPNLFGGYARVDGIIGYDVFVKFEIELQTTRQMITFRPAMTAEPDPSYNLIPIRLEDSRPVISSTVSLNGRVEAFDVVIDTGSSLGLLLKSSTGNRYPKQGSSNILGRGLNGPIEGTNIRADDVTLHDFRLRSLIAGVVHAPSSGTSSIGMDILKHYSLVLNYCKGYAGLKREPAPIAAVLGTSKPQLAQDF